MDSYRNINVPVMIFHRILQKFVGNIGHSVPNFSLEPFRARSTTVGGKECRYVITQEVGGQPVVAPTRAKGSAERRESQRKILTPFVRLLVAVAEGLASFRHVLYCPPHVS